MVNSQLENLTHELSSMYEQVLSLDDVDGAVSNVEVSSPDLDLAVDQEIVKILQQRSQHRDKLLDFLIRLTVDIVAFFTALSFTKVFIRLMIGVDVISDELLGTIAVSLFVEVIAVIRGITKALWNEKDILSSSLIDKISSKHRRVS